MYKLAIGLAFVFLCGPAFSQQEIARDPCSTDLSIALDAYLCSEAKLAVAEPKLAEALSSAIAAFPKKQGNGLLVTRTDIELSQKLWLSYTNKNCSLISALPGRAGDWHYPYANESFCKLREIESRIELLNKWKACAIEGGGICLP